MAELMSKQSSLHPDRELAAVLQPARQSRPVQDHGVRTGYGPLAHAGPILRLRSSSAADSDDLIRQAAQDGVQTPAGKLPYAEQIQSSFGRHDVSHIQAHSGPGAAATARAMNAAAYATGDHVVFAGTPDIRTAAHEAAHVVQQRGGVQLTGGIGQVGDPYEQHADAVADRVAALQPAEDLLDRLAGEQGPSPTAPVQRMPKKRTGTDEADDEEGGDEEHQDEDLGKAVLALGRAGDTSDLSPEAALELLGLDRDAGTGQVRSQYRRLVLLVHPDKGHTPDSQLFLRLQAAYSRALGLTVGVAPSRVLALPAGDAGAAPGGVEHLRNSCYAASLLTLISRVPQYRELFNPQQNPLAAESPGRRLQAAISPLIGAVHQGELVEGAGVGTLLGVLRDLGLLRADPAARDTPVTEQQQDAAEVLAAMLRLVMGAHNQDRFATHTRTTWQYDDPMLTNRPVDGHHPVLQVNLNRRLEDALADYFGRRRSAPAAQNPHYQTVTGINFPEVLTLSVVRYNDQPMDMPTEFTLPAGLTLNGQPGPRYRLQGFVLHNNYGGRGGHYVAYVPDERDQWYLADDMGGGGPRAKPSAPAAGSGGKEAERAPQVLASPSVTPAHLSRASYGGSRRQALTTGYLYTYVRVREGEEGDERIGIGPVRDQRRDPQSGPQREGFFRFVDATDLDERDLSFQGSDDEHLVQIADRYIKLLDDEGRRDVAVKKLNRLMLNERVYAHVAQRPDLFAKMYHRVKAPGPDPRFAFSTDPGVDKAKKGQQFFSVADQLHYILWKTGRGPAVRGDRVIDEGGYAHRPDWQEEGGTEIRFTATTETAREVQTDAIAKLIALYAGEDVRMPDYTHRFGPMLGRTALYGQSMTFDQYNAAAATNMNSILTSTDDLGANIRAGEADRGRGAYVSTDSDNYYGHHGIAFDRRDLHQEELSKDSLDNRHEHSSERTRAEGHQFRALDKAIPLTEHGKPKYADIFVAKQDEHTELLSKRLTPQNFTPGVLSNLKQEMLRHLLRRAMRPAPTAGAQPEKSAATGSPPPQVLPSPQHERPKSNEQVYLMQKLVQELEGLFEPHHWTRLWKENQMQRMMTQMAAMLQTRLGSMESTKKDEGESDDDDEWAD